MIKRHDIKCIILNKTDGELILVPINVGWEYQLENVPASIYWLDNDSIVRAQVKETILQIKKLITDVNKTE